MLICAFTVSKCAVLYTIKNELYGENISETYSEEITVTLIFTELSQEKIQNYATSVEKAKQEASVKI